MVEWAKLTPAERGQARLRFEEARQLPVPDRSERWRAYQALPPEQRQQLAARAATAASAPRDAASKPAKAGRDSKEAKFNVVPEPGAGAAAAPVAPTLVQAAPGATTTVITRRPTPPPHQQIGHAEDRDDARVREPLDPAAQARPAGRGGRVDAGCGGPAGAGRRRRRRRRWPRPAAAAAPPAPAPLAATPASATSR